LGGERRVIRTRTKITTGIFYMFSQKGEKILKI
jgi:hypothetical protein